MIFSFFINVVGIEHVGGDMFSSVPEGDAIFVKVLCLKHVNYGLY